MAWVLWVIQGNLIPEVRSALKNAPYILCSYSHFIMRTLIYRSRVCTVVFHVIRDMLKDA